jgi:hypothetical protein
MSAAQMSLLDSASFCDIIFEYKDLQIIHTGGSQYTARLLMRQFGNSDNTPLLTSATTTPSSWTIENIGVRASLTANTFDFLHSGVAGFANCLYKWLTESVSLFIADTSNMVITGTVAIKLRFW